MINLKNISFSYDKNLILNNLNLDIESNNFIAIVGKSGCGKTTLINLISGHLYPNQGQILINNKEIRGPNRNRVVISQENDLFDWMTVRQNLEIVSKDNDSINKYLKIADLFNHQQKFPNQLSGGMKKKLAIIRAIVSGSNIILMDEVFSSLDYLSKENLYTEIKDIFNTTQKTIILVTHDIDEAIYLANKIIILKDENKTQEIKIPTDLKKEVNWQNSTQFLNLKNQIKNELL